MALQLTGAFKKASVANLQVQLPAIVIGGGLTAIDTATELLAYYPVQVEKNLQRFESLCGKYGEESAWGMCDEEEREILKTFLEHGRAVRKDWPTPPHIVSTTKRSSRRSRRGFLSLKT
jgi:NADPH-dependent glutamate synthase beta subunit-like oxidoreductase